MRWRKDGRSLEKEFRKRTRALGWLALALIVLGLSSVFASVVPELSLQVGGSDKEEVVETVFMFSDHYDTLDFWNFWGSFTGGKTGANWKTFKMTSNAPKWKLYFDNNSMRYILNVRGDSWHARGLYNKLYSVPVWEGVALNSSMFNVTFYDVKAGGQVKTVTLVVWVYDVDENKTYGLVYAGGRSLEPRSADGTTYYSLPGEADVKLRFYTLDLSQLLSNSSNVTLSVLSDLASKGYDLSGHRIKVYAGFGVLQHSDDGSSNWVGVRGFGASGLTLVKGNYFKVPSIRLFVLLVGWAAAGLLVFKAYREMGVAV